MTYTALALLRILGDDFTGVKRKPIMEALKQLQCSDGSFMPIVEGAESDMRFVFCAAAISSLLEDWSGVDVDRMLSFVKSSQSYDFGYGLNPCLESHGGATYCAVASLNLIGWKFSTEGDLSNLTTWGVHQQGEFGGFRGRCNKVVDPCYAFWIGASLEILGSFHLVDKAALRATILECQCNYGGFSKIPNQHPDPLHTFYSICGLSLIKEPGIATLYCPLGVPAHSMGKIEGKDDRNEKMEVLDSSPEGF